MPRRNTTKLSSKNQATIPVAVLREAGVRPGDELIAEATAPGEIRLVRSRNRLDAFAGRLSGVYRTGYLRRLRREWD